MESVVGALSANTGTAAMCFTLIEMISLELGGQLLAGERNL